MSAAAIVSKLSGTAHALRDGGSIPLSEGSELSVSDAVSTAEGSRLELRFADDTELSLGPLTQVQIRDFAYDPAEAVEPAFAVHIMEGLARTVSGGVVKQNPEAFKLSSPMGTAGIRGTTIEAVISGKEEFWSVVEMAKGHTVLFATADGRFFRLAEAQGEAVRFTLGTDGFTLEPLTQQEVEILLQEAEEAARNAEKNEGAAAEDHSSSVIIVAMEEDLNRLAEMELLEGSVLQPIDEELYEEFLADMGQSQRLEDDLYFLEDSGGGGGSGSGESGWTPQAIVGYTGTNWTSTLGHTDELYINRSGQYGSTTTGTVTLNSDQGSDRIVFFGQGATTVIGGYGSSDTIYCVGDAGGTVSCYIHGDANDTITSERMDDDLIIVRGSDNTSGALHETDADLQRLDVSGLPSVTFIGTIYGDATVLQGSAVGGNDTITLKGNMGDGTFTADIAGDARDLDSGGTCGNDIIIVTGDMTNGSRIYGDAQNLLANAVNVTCGNDTITVTGNLTGTAMNISGDVWDIFNGADSITCGNDKITVNGDVGANSTICGDVDSNNSAATIIYGNDTIIVTGTLSDSGAIYGDFNTGGSLDGGGNDYISVGKVAGNGAIHGNGGSDTIHVGELALGEIYGGDGNDMVRLDKVSGSNELVDLGAGKDILVITALNDNDALMVDCGNDADMDIIDLSLINRFTGSAEITVKYFEQGEDSLKLGSNWVITPSDNNTLVLKHNNGGGTVEIKVDTGSQINLSDTTNLTTNESINYSEFNIP